VHRALAPVVALTLVACGAAGAAKAPPQPRFSIPYALEFGPDGALYIADGGFGRVLRYVQATKRRSVFARGIAEPVQMIRDGQLLYVSDIRANRVVRIDRRGRVRKLADMRAPAGLALHGSKLYVSSLESFIDAIELESGAVERIAGDGTPESTGDGGLARDAHVESPHAIAFDPAWNLYVEGAGTIRRIDAATGVITTVSRQPGSQFAIARDGTVYFTAGSPSGGTVRRLEPDGSATIIAGNGTLRPAGDRRRGTTVGMLPTDLLLTRDESALLVGQSRPFPAVRRLDLRTGVITTLVRGR
jgi:sugar lactone lactonase YvrE